MRDLIRFVWRGALGGAIVPSLFWVYYLLLFFDTPAFWYVLIFSSPLLVPGAIVGVSLWFCALYFERLGLRLRVMIGMATTSAILALGWLASTESVFKIFQDPQYVRRVIFWSVYYLVIGGTAAWICPATTIFRKEPEQSYSERVREYEKAQAEHEYWKTQLALGKSQAEKRSV